MPLVQTVSTIAFCSRDNCTQANKYELDKIRNEATRIAIGATKLVSINNLYKKIDRNHYKKRDNDHKLTLFFKMKTHLAPEYLSPFISQQVNNIAGFIQNGQSEIP